MNIELSGPQRDFFVSDAKATCAVAGYGSGKTDVAMFRLITSAIEYPDGDWLYCAPTIPLIRDILWSKLEEFLPAIGIGYTINKSEGIVYLHGYGKIFCRSMDNPERLIGFQVVDAFLDELDTLTAVKAVAVFMKIKARCRQKVVDRAKTNGKVVYKKNQIWVTTTPEGFRGTYELFKRNPAESSRLIEMTTYSNAHNLPEDYIDDLRASYPPQLIDAYLLGKFVNLNSLGVWSSYDADQNHLDVNVIKGETLYIGQDFNVGRGCAVPYVKRTLKAGHEKNVLGKQTKVFVACGEVVDTYDTQDTIRALEEMFPKNDFSDKIIHPDATGENRKSVNATLTDLALMRSAGYKIKQHAKNPPIKDRVISSNAAFLNAEGVIKVFVDKNKCPVFSDALTQQAYDKNGLPEKGALKGDDITDAGTYPIEFHYPLRPNKMFTTTVGGL